METPKTTRAGLWDILSVIIKWRRLFVINFIAAAIITFIIASFLPKWYTSHATIFPPERESSGMSLSSLLGGSGLGMALSGGGMSLPSFVTLSDVYSSILLSREVAEGVIEKNNLMEAYGVQSIEPALVRLAGQVAVSVEPNGMIKVFVEDKDPEMAMILVNSFIEGLNDINRKVRTSKASAARQFIEERLVQNKIELDSAEEAYKQFQIDNKAISLLEQVQAQISSLATLKSQQVMAEIELGVLKHSLLPTHTKIKQKEAKIEEIKRQIRLFEEGSSDSGKEGIFSLSMADAPELGLELGRLTRNLKIQEAIFELLTQQHEQAKIQEKRNTPTIQILDPPKIPEKKSRPKRIKLSILAGAFCFFLTFITVFFKEFIDRNKESDTEIYHHLENIANTLKEDVYAIKSIFISKKGDKSDQTG
ncbi:MAG: hypothetical protein J7K40_13350 [candidate division Zixibacteria bacterium]|nr:hypothetical protein [candidate division Zixibacteria bacterium]